MSSFFCVFEPWFLWVNAPFAGEQLVFESAGATGREQQAADLAGFRMRAPVIALAADRQATSQVISAGVHHSANRPEIVNAMLLSWSTRCCAQTSIDVLLL